MASNGIQYVSGGGATVDGITVMSGGDITITPPRNVVIASGSLMINETNNVKMTIGLTINQGAADNEIISFKSSDVDHPMTDNAEADTFGYISKVEGTSGGMALAGFKDADGAPGYAFLFLARLGEAADTTHTTAGIGVTHIQSSITDGSVNITALASGGNAFVVENKGTAEFIVDGAGNLYANAGTTTTAVTVFDEEDDLALVRVLDIAKSKVSSRGFIESEFDRFLKYNENDLVEAGIIGAPLAEGGLICITRLQQLHNGALTQLGNKLSRLEATLVALEERNARL
ncbi:hypothetical protein LCGC14_2151990 [marine sediment metagenome]|uniref:Peptidase S74 domain-containing protein n=2 Tax=marine sediment metagenome TaxID=412755 RepID=A0A0F9GRK7_9ZZZZ